MRTLDLDQHWPAAKLAAAMPETDSDAGAQRGFPESVEGSSKYPHDHIQDTVQIPPGAALRDGRTPIIWGGLGFVAGMFAWHVIGFWSFVTHVAFNDDARVATTASGSQQNVVPPQKFKTSANGNDLEHINPGNCVALAIDRTGGEAKPGACPADGRPLTDAGRTRRSDLTFARPRLQDPQIWAGVTAVESEVAADTIDESDFDLTIRPGP